MEEPLFKKIVWAVDPLETEEPSLNAKFLIGSLSREGGTEIEPVFVLRPPYANYTEASTPIQEAFLALAEKRMAAFVKSAQIPNLKAGRVLTDHSGSTKKAAQILIDYAADKKADAIVVSTHARSGVARLFMGSFAETLALHSTIPIFSVNPNTKVREKISKILFPTDFISPARPAFETVVRFAKATGAELTLFYKEPFIPNPYKSDVLYQIMQQEALRREKDAVEWQGWATHQGVPTSLHLDNHPGYLVNAMAEFAEKGNFDLVAVPSEADAVSAVLVGSAARQMFRHSPCPVWTSRIQRKA